VPFWCHNICRKCWDLLFPNIEPHRQHAYETICCFCGERNNDGIFLRWDGTLLKCEGKCA